METETPYPNTKHTSVPLSKRRGCVTKESRNAVWMRRAVAEQKRTQNNTHPQRTRRTYHHWCQPCLKTQREENTQQRVTSFCAFPPAKSAHRHAPRCSTIQKTAAENLVEEKSVLDCRRISRKLQHPKWRSTRRSTTTFSHNHTNNLCCEKRYKIQQQQHTILQDDDDDGRVALFVGGNLLNNNNTIPTYTHLRSG